MSYPKTGDSQTRADLRYPLTISVSADDGATFPCSFDVDTRPGELSPAAMVRRERGVTSLFRLTHVGVLRSQVPWELTREGGGVSLLYSWRRSRMAYWSMTGAELQRRCAPMMRDESLCKFPAGGLRTACGDLAGGLGR